MGNRGISLIILLVLSSFYLVNSSDNNIENNIVENIPTENQDIQKIQNNFQEPLKENSISQKVSTTEVTNSIETNSITSETHSPGRDSYIVDFGFHQIYSYSASQEVYNGIAGYIGLNETAFFSVDLTIPVNMTIQYSNSVEAGKKSTINVDLFKVPGGASFSVSYGFTLGGSYRIGLGNLKTFKLVNYTNTYEFIQMEVPMDPVPLTEFTFPLPLGAIPYVGPVIDQIFGIDLVMAPQLDVDIAADLFYDGIGAVSTPKLNFKTVERQSFTIDVDNFSKSSNNVKFGLNNFSMDFYLSLLWSIQLKLKGFFSFIGPWRLNLFTFPRVPIGGLPTTAEAYGLLDITPTQELPEYSLDTYSLSDGSNNILEPGDTASLSADFFNIGKGPAMNANVTAFSQNVTLSSGATSKNYFNSADNTFTHDVSFTLSNGYTDRNITIYYDISWLAVNGSIRTQQEELVIRVLQPGDAYLSIDNWSIFEPLDGKWDAGETARIDVDLSKIGTASVVYADLEILGYYSSLTYTSNDTFDSINTVFTTWNSTGMFLTAPTDVANRALDVLVGVTYQLSTGQVNYDYQIITLEIHPLSASIEIVQAYATHDISFDGYFMAGETYSMSADISNIGNDISGSIVGLFVTDDPDVFIHDDVLLDWSSLNQGQNSVSTNTILVDINSGAKNKTITIYLITAFETWYGEVIFDIFGINMDIVQQPDPIPDLKYYEIYDSQLVVSTLTPGETSLVTVGLDVLGGNAYDSIAYLTSNNENVFIYNSTSYYGDMNLGSSSEGDGFVVYIPANFAGGTVRFSVNVTMHNGAGELIYTLAYFDVAIAAGDVDIPSFTRNSVTTAKEGDTVTIELTAVDNKGVDKIYFAYFDYALNDWAIKSIEWTGTPSVSIDVVMGSDTLYYALIVFDVSGNYAAVGLDTPLEVTVDSSSVSSGTTNTTPPTNSTTPVSKPQNSNETPSPLSTFIVIISLIAIPIIRRKK